ncbi:YgiQ family radical SAM protein [Pseudomonas aeruginosa]|nr:YgiQ family radical SAM protein [Pseudomonas aeruginosa]
MRPLVATVDLSAIRHNYALAKRCAPQRQAFAVVKANAYGHGAREVVTALHDDADGFAVACLEEAAEVRALHASARILLLEGCFEASEYALAGQLRLDLVIQGAEQGEAFLAAGLDIPLNVWLKLDSGMHRLGFDPAALRAWHARLRNHERAVVEIAQRLAQGEPLSAITDVRGTAFVRRDTPEGWFEIDSTRIDRPGKIDKIINPYVNTQDTAACAIEQEKGAQEDPQEAKVVQLLANPRLTREKTVIRLPSFEKVRNDPVLYAHANRVLHLETNPGNARALVQKHGEVDVWFNPPPIPMSTEEMDYVFGMPYARVPHPAYGKAKIPAYEMIRFSVNIMRGCFGGCTFCSITEHEGRIIQNRSHDSIIREIEEMRDKVPGFTGVVSDLGGPTANMYRIACKSPDIERHCRKPSCVFPGICENLDTDHSSLIELYRKARALPGVKKILIASGLRYDLAVESPEYVKELVTHHVGGYLKIAPEHTERGPLDKMMKPGIGTYDRFKQMFEKFSKEAGKEQYLIPYFIAAHPGTTDEDMMNLALWLKRNGFRADQVQAFYPSPMATATAMYHSGKNPLRKVTYKSDGVTIVKSDQQRRLHKAFLRYHDPKGWPLLREALERMGRADLIGNGKHHLVPTYQPDTGEYQSARRKNSTPAGSKKAGKLLTQHTGLPPRASDGGKPWSKGQQNKATAFAKGKKKSRQPNIPR